MRKLRQHWQLAVTAAALLALAGCSRPKAVVAPAMPSPVEPSRAPTGSAAAPRGTLTVQAEPSIAPAQSPESQVASSELPADLEQINRAGYLKDAFFDTDKAELRPDAREALAEDAAWLRAHLTVKIMIEGHCDERNTAEYNLALGWRRANAVKDYLVFLGAAANNVETISYGEERPFALGHEESAWSQNRRAHFVVTAH